MNQTTCPGCRLRFARDPAAHLDACPRCAEPLTRTSSAQDALGYSLFDDDSSSHAHAPAGGGYAALVAALRERS